MVCINFQLNVEEFPALGLTLLMDLNYSKSIVSGFFNEQTAKEHKTQQRGNTSGEISDDDMYALNNNEGFQSSGRNVVRPVHLESFDEPNTSYKGDNMDILMDIPLQVAVELGRTKKSLKEILGLNVGSIVTLDKLVGEPVDIVINSKAIAKGEVVVCDDNFGVRIMDILNTNAK